MAKWKWHEEMLTVNKGHPMDAIDYGWRCADCGIDLDKYLSESGYTHPVSMTKMKRNAPKMEYCPCCGVKKAKE